MAFRRRAPTLSEIADIWQRDFLVLDLARAVGRPRATLAAWAHRGAFSAAADPADDLRDKGAWRRFSLVDLFAAAVAEASAPLGVAVSDSTLAARACLDDLQRARGPIPTSGLGLLTWLRGVELVFTAVPAPGGGHHHAWALAEPVGKRTPRVVIPLFEVLRAANDRLKNETPSREDGE